jgi:hypothetical protein
VPGVADPQMREYVGQLATLMDERRERIGAHAADQQPSRAVEALGPVPEYPGGAIWPHPPPHGGPGSRAQATRTLPEQGFHVG